MIDGKVTRFHSKISAKDAYEKLKAYKVYIKSSLKYE